MSNLLLEPRHAEIVWSIIQKFPFTFYAFGSRVVGEKRKFSDLDLFIKEPVTSLQLFYIKDAFGESNLPFTVDVVLQQDCDKSFIEKVSEDLMEINKNTLGIKE